MRKVRSAILACSALAPIAFSVPAHAAMDPSLRGSLTELRGSVDDDGASKPEHKLKPADLRLRSLDFASSEDRAPSTMYLATASTGTGYNKTAKQISAAMGYIGQATGAGVIIGIVDTGVDRNNAQFLTATGASRILPGTCLPGYSTTLCASANNKLGGDDKLWPTITHGTHVAGIAAGLSVGLAPDASILPVRVCDSVTGSCPGDIDGGILWASQHHASVINLSLGGSFLTTRDIVTAQTAIANGSLIVVAAGNAGNSRPTSGFLAGAALYNGIRGSLVVVGALGANNKIAYYSQTPGNTCMVQSGQNYCMKNYFVVAPGSSIISSVGGGKLESLSGTSMATPFVSGLAAEIKGLWPYLKPSDVASIIFSTADDLGAPGPDPVYGMGEVDPTNALNPVGTVNVVTGGLSVTNITTTVAGVKTASVSGVLSTGIRENALLKNVLVVDQFGRDFTADLTKGSQNQGFDISSFVMLDQMLASSNAPGTVNSGLHAISSSGYSPELGLVTMSGLVSSSTTPAIFSSNASAVDVVRSYVSNLAVSASPTADVSFDVGYKLNLTGRINEFDANSSPAFAGLFLSASAVNSPYASLTSGGNYAGTTVSLVDGVDVRAGYSWMSPDRQTTSLPPNDGLAQFTMHNQNAFDQRAANSAVMSVSWKFADWGGLGVTASQTSEQNGVLGGVASGALNVGRASDTSAIDTSLRLALGRNWLATLSYGEGVTQLNQLSSSLFSSASALRSRSYGIAVATHDVLGNDALGFAVTRPMYAYSGSATVTAATNIDDAGNLTISHGLVSFAEATPETDLEVGYSKSFMDGRLSLQSDAAYQMDLGGQSGRNAATFVTRLKLGL